MVAKAEGHTTTFLKWTMVTLAVWKANIYLNLRINFPQNYCVKLTLQENA